MNARNERRNRITVSLMFAAAAAPFLLSWVLVNFTDVGRGGNSGNHGTLIVPPRPVPDAVLHDPGTRRPDHALHGRWTLLYLAGPVCAADCAQALLTMRQVRLALGRDATRVQRLLAVPDDALDLLAPQQREAYAGQLVIELSRLGRERFLLEGGEDPVSASRIYLIDPLGNLMMYYRAGTDPLGIVKDIKRLLKYSRIG